MINRFSTFSIKIIASFFEVDELILKFEWKNKGARITKIILEKKDKGGLLLPDCKIYCDKCDICTERPISQWNKLEDPGIEPSLHL